ncbi:MAG: tetratricopeptide repeat protein [Coriobacteriales bacterium]|jgi:TPR repeat protein
MDQIRLGYQLPEKGVDALISVLKMLGVNPEEEVDPQELPFDWQYQMNVYLTLVDDQFMNLGEEPVRTFVTSFLTTTYEHYVDTDRTKAGNSACDIGALYYTGRLSDDGNPDYESAFEWYQKGAELDNVQSLINLGYCYEYGRVGERNPDKAFKCYLLASCIGDLPEALYKFGDCFSRGNGVEKNKDAAFGLYFKAYRYINQHEGGSEEIAPEVKGSVYKRLADCLFYDEMVMDDVTQYGYKFEIDRRMEILRLYQDAERCFRVAIENGATYYSKQLEKVIEQQDAIRNQFSE